MGRRQGRRRKVERWTERNTHLPLEVTHEHAVQDLARLVAVSYVLERLGRILAAHVEEDFLATTVVLLVSLALYARALNVCSGKALGGWEKCWGTALRCGAGLGGSREERGICPFFLRALEI